MPTLTDAYLALDVGEKRIGVAIARSDVKIASPLVTLSNDSSALEAIKQLVDENKVMKLIIGLPRNLNGDDTPQTETVRHFAHNLQSTIPNLQIIFQDEALTSVKAEAELAARKKPFEKADVDALAATYIMEDYLRDHKTEGAAHVPGA